MLIRLFCCTLLLFSCKSVPISRDRMAKIIVEMSMIDQMVQDQPEVRLATDTALVYEAIFRKYGYTQKEFDLSLTYHIQKPNKLSKKIAPYRDQLVSRRDALQKAISDATRTPAVDSLLLRRVDSLMRHWRIDSLIRRDTVTLWRVDTVRPPVFSMIQE